MTNQPLVLPLDEANRALLEHVHPPAWRNPIASGVYDLVVIGGGTAGLVSAVGAAGLGARVALIERALLGGDCLNVGCVPSKALLRSARAVGEVRKARQVGVRVADPEVDFSAIMARMRRRRAEISPTDSAARLARAGVDVYFGQAAFVDPRSVAVEGQALRFKRGLIATGGRPDAPPVPGLADVPYVTNETLFWLTELPKRLAVIGAGPIGCEMAQAFARFGSEVTLFDVVARILPREDADAAAIVERRLESDGVRLELGVRLTQVTRRDGEIAAMFSRSASPGEEQREAVGDHVLVAAGRRPNIEGLNLEAADIEWNKEGVLVNDRLQTTNPRVYASGDVCSAFKFTHAADAMSRVVLQNALFWGRKRVSSLVIPWCTYTIPEVAHVGFSEKEAAQQGRRVETLTIQMREIDRAVVDEETEGFVRVHHEGGRLVGCTIVASHAGDLIGQASYVMSTRGTLAQLSSTIFPYPTQAEAFRKAGDAYRRGMLSDRLRWWLERYFCWRP